MFPHLCYYYFFNYIMSKGSIYIRCFFFGKKNDLAIVREWGPFRLIHKKEVYNFSKKKVNFCALLSKSHIRKWYGHLFELAVLYSVTPVEKELLFRSNK